MTSWTALTPVPPGTLVSPSFIDAILDDITILSTHSHSGSAGDGSNVLAPNTRLSSQQVVGFNLSKHYMLPHIVPASNNGWGTVTYTASLISSWVYDGMYLQTDSFAASGASLIYNIPVVMPEGSASVSVNVYFTSLKGPNAGCIAACINGASQGLIGGINGGGNNSLQSAAVAFPVNNAASNSGYFRVQFTAASPVVHQLKLQINGKDGSSTGYGACIMMLRMGVNGF